jgi:hypothetical protein
MALTATGAIVGTPGYLAPEQARGESKRVTTAADVYALGAILYELLTGQPPFRAETAAEALLQVLQAEPAPPSRLRPGLPRDLETICLKCLHKEPSRRYESAAALADDLERWLRGEPIQARPAGPTERLWRWCRRNPALALVTAGFVLALLLGQATTTWQWWRAEKERQRADEARGDAERQAEESRQRLVQQYVANGERLADEGDPCSALAWLAEALDLDRGDAQREWPTASPCTPSSGRRRGCSTSGSFPTWPTPAMPPAPTAAGCSRSTPVAWPASGTRTLIGPCRPPWTRPAPSGSPRSALTADWCSRPMPTTRPG